MLKVLKHACRQPGRREAILAIHAVKLATAPSLNGLSGLRTPPGALSMGGCFGPSGSGESWFEPRRGNSKVRYHCGGSGPFVSSPAATVPLAGPEEDPLLPAPSHEVTGGDDPAQNVLDRIQAAEATLARLKSGSLARKSSMFLICSLNKKDWVTRTPGNTTCLLPS